MDSRRLILFIVLSVGMLFVWDKLFPQPVSNNSSHVNVAGDNSSNNASTNPTNNPNSITNNPNTAGYKTPNQTEQIITVTTDVLKAQISTIGGDIKELSLLNHGSDNNKANSYNLLTTKDDRVYVAQTGLVDNTNIELPNHNSLFKTNSLDYKLNSKDDLISVPLTFTNSNGINITKTITFKKGSYVVNVGYQINNPLNTPIKGVSAYWRLLRDDKSSGMQSKFVHTFTGVGYYSNETKFNKISFDDIEKNNFTIPDSLSNGWVGYIQHYFISMWLLNAYNYTPVCANGVTCRINIKEINGNFSAGLLTDLPQINPHTTYNISVPLFAGPQEYNALLYTAPELERTKDYGWVYIFATPLFWLLVKLFGFIQNWGWSIVALTVIVKLVLYPLTRASYISMAKMKMLAPKIETLKSSCGEDKVKLQRGMMELYRSEKVNPIGGCLPMLLQIPVFIGLYWALLSSVELRQASFLWVKDLSMPDPYYILPAILAVTMFLQTFMSPPPADPMQAKMMRIMPVAFSVMFFFFPSGLVVYWLINNVLSISQQWYVNNHVTLRHKNKIKNIKTKS